MDIKIRFDLLTTDFGHASCVGGVTKALTDLRVSSRGVCTQSARFSPVGHLAGAVEYCSASQRRRDPRCQGRLRRAIKHPADTARPLCTRRPLGMPRRGGMDFLGGKDAIRTGSNACPPNPLFWRVPTVTILPPITAGLLTELASCPKCLRE